MQSAPEKDTASPRAVIAGFARAVASSVHGAAAAIGRARLVVLRWVRWQRWAPAWKLALSVAVGLTLFAIVWLDPDFVTTRLQFHPETVLPTASSSEVVRLRAAMVVDLLLILTYGGVLYRLAWRWGVRAADRPPDEPYPAWERSSAWRRRKSVIRYQMRSTAWLALTVAAFDVAENVMTLVVLGDPATPPAWARQLVSAFAWAKWTVLLLVLVSLVQLRSGLGRRGVERALVNQMADRAAVRLNGPPSTAPTRKPSIGVACSGGGIRSAAFTLGAMQALGESDELRDRVTHVTAVSGGSYVAGAMRILQSESSEDVARPFAPGSPEARHLRNRTNYLAPGFMGKVRAVTRWSRGVMLNLVVLGIGLWVVARPVGWLVSSDVLYPELEHLDNPADAVLARSWLAAAVLTIVALVAASIPQTRRTTDDDKRNALYRYSDQLLRSVAIVLVLHIAIPYSFWMGSALTSGLSSVAGSLFAVAVAGGAGYAVLRSIVAPYAGGIARAVAGLVVPVVVVGSFVALSTHAALGRWPPWLTIGTYAAAVLALLWLSHRDAEAWSLHPFYKRRLGEAFALRRQRSTEHFDPAGHSAGDAGIDIDNVHPADLKWLSEASDNTQSRLNREALTRRELTICAAANVCRDVLTPPGRNALSFTFSEATTGVADAGFEAFRTTSSRMQAQMDREGRRDDFTLLGAMSISGAAVSPAMGRYTNRSFQALLAMLNVRLGVWLPNPVRLPAMSTNRVRKPRIVPYFFKEMLGLHSLADDYLYVTDGGHWDNLGLVELLRHRCRVVICLDAGGDGPGSFNGIGQAMSLAGTELGAKMHFSPERLRCPEASKTWYGKRRRPSLAPANHAYGTIEYAGDPEPAVFIYCRTAVTKDASWAVRAYQERHPEFPCHSTLTVMFDDERFEAYRTLGEQVVREAIEGAWRRGLFRGIGLDRQAHETPPGLLDVVSGARGGEPVAI